MISPEPPHLTGGEETAAMSTPAKRPRAVDDDAAASAAPTKRKAQRVQKEGGEAQSFSATLLDFTAEVHAWRQRGQGPNERERELVQKAFSALGSILRDQREQERERKRLKELEALDETPLSSDLLAHALSWLSAADLAAATQSSKHFHRTSPEAVRLHLDRLVQNVDLRFRRNELSIELLKDVEDECRRVSVILSQVSPAQALTEDSAFEELMELRPQVICSMSKPIMAKVQEFHASKIDPDAESFIAASIRDNLMIVLGRARLPSQELVKIEKDVMDHLEGERNAELGVFQVMGAFTLIRRMPPATIQKHIQKLVWWVMNGEEDALEALECLEALSPATLGPFKAQIAGAPIASSKRSRETDKVRKLLKSISA